MDKQRLDAIRARCEAATIPNFPGYTVTEDGRVFSSVPWRGTSRRELKQHPNSHGYMRVHMVGLNGRSSKLVHSLVAAAFLPEKPTDADQIRHLNGDKTDNCAANLAWGTAKQNAQDRERHGTTARGERNGASRLAASDVLFIKALGERGFSQRRIARVVGTSQRNVGRILNGERWN